MLTRDSRARLLTLLLVLIPAGCTTWQPVRVSPATFFAEADADADVVRVYRSDGARTQLRAPHVVGDYLEGELYGTRGTTERVRLDDVTAVEVRLASGGRAFAAFTLLASVVTLIAVSQAY